MDERRPGDREERLDLYRIAVEEYRFQVQLNWDRAKYLLGFNVAVISVGAGLVQLGPSVTPLLAGVFLVGALAAILSVIAVALQHSYYQRIRDDMVAQGQALNLGTRAVATTPGAQGARRGLLARLGRVQSILYVLLTTSAAVDGLGIWYVLSR